MAVKTKAAMECEVKDHPNLARKYRECSMFTGEENVEELAKLLTSPQGVEFCTRYNFPNLASMRAFRMEKAEKYGVYIDPGTLTIDNPKHERVAIAGRGTVTINISDNDRRYEIILLCGAKAVVNASKWAVVTVHAQQGCYCLKNTADNAIIL